LFLASLSTFGFRNLEPTTVQWSEGVNLVLGANGQGKTNLLEAVAVLCNLRSFRTSLWRSMVRHGETSFRLAGELLGAAGHRKIEQLVDVGPPLQRRLLIDGRQASFEEYLSLCPLAALTAADRELVTGPPEMRRQFIDRVAFALDPRMYGVVRGYRRLLRQRNSALTAGASDDEIEVWEAQLAVAAGELVEHRISAVRRLEQAFQESYREFGETGFPEVELRYRRDPLPDAPEGHKTLEESYRERYNETRARDRQVGYTVVGPHRHDLTLHGDGRPVRDVLSSGQTKVVAAALRLAMVALLEQERGERFPVIVDDVDAELDPSVVTRFGGRLGRETQVLASSAGGGNVATGLSADRTYRIRAGVCREVSDFGENGI
jgi:DNA replication and repair protein RecF